MFSCDILLHPPRDQQDASRNFDDYRHFLRLSVDFVLLVFDARFFHAEEFRIIERAPQSQSVVFHVAEETYFI